MKVQKSQLVNRKNYQPILEERLKSIMDSVEVWEEFNIEPNKNNTENYLYN